MQRSTRPLGWVCALLFVAPSVVHAQGLFAPGLESPGLSDAVSALATFDPDGTGPAPAALYAGGEFAAAALTPANNLASWNGSAWSAVGTGTNGWIGALETFDADGTGPAPAALYLGGAFKSAGGLTVNHVARWNGSSFAALGPGLDDWVNALAVFDADGSGPQAAALYVGGNFDLSGTIVLNGIARWSGSAFQPLASGLDAPAASMVVFNGALYVGGYFTKAGNVTVNGIARWTGTAWQAVGTGFDGAVQALAVFDADGTGPLPAELVAGGAFRNAGTTAVGGVARWNGTAWSALSTGVTAPGAYAAVRALKVVPEGGTPRLYAAGLFHTAGAAAAPTPQVPDAPGCGGLLAVARWDGSAWTTLGAGLECGADDVGRALLSFDDDQNGVASLFVGGHFSQAGTSSASGVARWNGATWSRLGTGQGLSASVHALAIGTVPLEGTSAMPVAAGGDFAAAGTTPANRVALWDGVGWRAVGAGGAGSQLDGRVRALLFQGASLYVGGTFQTANGNAVGHVARWSGTAGSELAALGGGTDGDVLALASFQGAVVAGGAFTSAGGALTNGVAAWSEAGGTWSALGAGVDGTVRALLVFDDGSGSALYAAGDFKSAGELAAPGVARWDGAEWRAVGEGLSSSGVYALAAFDDGGGLALYAGGAFESSGAESASGVARWDPATGAWTALDTGLEGGFPTRCFALAAWNGGGGPALVAGGDFNVAGSTAVSNLALWTGTSWSAFGTGANGAVRALVPDTGSGKLFVGGDFTVIDGRTASRVARTQ